MVHPFRFNVILEHLSSREMLIAKAKRVEDLGYSTLLAPDHFWLPIDPAVVLMAIADATSLRVGSHVFSNDFRHPVLVARQAALLDLLSEGRFQLGLGAGYSASDYTQTGIPYDRPGVRIGRLEEAVQVIKHFFVEPVMSFSGRYYQIHDLTTGPKSVQRPHPPIYIGGSGKRILTLAGREADIVGIAAETGPEGMNWDSTGPQATAQRLSWVREAAGDRFNQLELTSVLVLVHITDYREQVLEQMPQRLAAAMADHSRPTHLLLGNIPPSPQQLAKSQRVLIGSAEQMVEELQSRREQYRFSTFEVFESQIEALAPVVARLAGT